MLGVLTILAMFAFLFIPVWMELMGTHKTDNPVAVTTSKFGDLHDRDLSSMLETHRRVLAVLSDVMQKTGIPPSMLGRMLEARFGPATPEGVVTNWVLAKCAQQMGMTISDAMINTFLKGAAQDQINWSGFQAIFKQHGLTEYQFFNAMRNELAAVEMEEIFQTSLAALTPAQRWEYFAQVKQLATIEAVGVPAANYVRRVDEPANEELKTFFEQHKDTFALPESPEAGFRQPQEVALAYFKANMEKFSANVTDKEIEDRYAKNKEFYDQATKKSEASLPGLNQPELNNPELNKPELKQPETKKKAEEPATKSGQPATDAKPAPKQGAGDAPAAKPQPEAKTPSKPGAPEQGKNAKKTSAIEWSSPFVLTSLLAEEKSAEKAKPPAKEAKPAEKPVPPAPAKPEAKPAGNPPPAIAAPAAAQKPPAAKPATTPAEKPPAPAAPTKPAAAKTGLTESTKNHIRQEIAVERVAKVFDGLQQTMNAYQDAWSAHEVAVIHQQSKQAEAATAKNLPPLPPPPDFDKLATQNGLTAGRTDLISRWELSRLEIGSSLVGGREPVSRYAFSLAKFHPEESQGLEGDRYLFWKTDDRKEQVPKFDDKGVREQVLRAWKLIHARSLAIKEADSLAAEARKTKKPLKQAFVDRPDLHIILPPAFSWVTFGNVPLGSAPNAARLSEVPGVYLAGEDFMRTVFHLERGQIGVAMNAPKTVAYVIQLKELSPSREVLWKQFEVDDFSKYAPAANTDKRQMYQAWLKEIKSSVGLEWKHKPDHVRDSGPAEGPDEE